MWLGLQLRQMSRKLSQNRQTDLQHVMFQGFQVGERNLQAHFLMKDIRINNKPVFCKTSFDKRKIYLNDLQFNIDYVRSYESFKHKGLNTNFLT